MKPFLPTSLSSSWEGSSSCIQVQRKPLLWVFLTVFGIDRGTGGHDCLSKLKGTKPTRTNLERAPAPVRGMGRGNGGFGGQVICFQGVDPDINQGNCPSAAKLVLEFRGLCLHQECTASRSSVRRHVLRSE